MIPIDGSEFLVSREGKDYLSSSQTLSPSGAVRGSALQVPRAPAFLHAIYRLRSDGPPEGLPRARQRRPGSGEGAAAGPEGAAGLRRAAPDAAASARARDGW